ncbi:efflux RND transporter periplasmic adaptor subunit [Acidobacteriota bacterium]
MVFSKKLLTIVLVIIILGVGSYFLFFNKLIGTQGESSDEASEGALKPTETPLPVRVATSKIDDLVIKLRSPGEAVTNRMIVIKAEVSGVVKDLGVVESQKIKKGDLLLSIEDETYALDVERTEAERLKVLSELLLEKQFDEGLLSGEEFQGLQEMEFYKKYEKAKDLFQQGTITQAEFERASKEYEYAMIQSGRKKEEIMAATKRLTQTEIDLRQKRMQLLKTKIRAPFGGIITDIKIAQGEHLSSGQELFTLVNIDRIQVHAKVLESEVGKMKVGREVDLKFSAYSNKVFKGRVRAISPIIDPSDKTCNVIVDVGNPEEQIKPGMHAEVEIAAEIYKDRLLIPQDAVLSRSGRKLAFVVVDGVAKWRYLEIGLENEDYAEVLDGIKEGDTVLIDGHFTLAHDAKVRIVE